MPGLPANFVPGFQAGGPARVPGTGEPADAALDPEGSLRRALVDALTQFLTPDRAAQLSAVGSLSQRIVNIGTASTRVVEANPNRKYLLIRNSTVTTVNIAFNRDAASGDLPIDASTGSIEFNRTNLYTGDIRGIATAPTTLIVVEGS